MPEKDVDSDIDRVDAMRILHTTHQLYGTGVSYGVLPHHGSLGRHRATQTRALPPSHACLATLSTRADRLCERITRCSDEQRDVRERSHRELNATDDKGLIPVRTRDRRLTGGSLEGAYQRRTHAQRTYTVLKTVHRCPEIAPPGRDAARRQATTHAGHTLPSVEYASNRRRSSK